MISIIVCSINDVLFDSFNKSVAETIGTAYEIIKIDNVNNLYSISEAYNIGAARAKFGYVCFVHEDVIFKTANWGQSVLNVFTQNEDVGLVGISGAKYKSLAPGGWTTGFSDLDCYNVMQRYGQETSLQVFNPEGNSTLVEVATLDGVFLFTKKEIWNRNRFDSQTFKGFHCYDLDFCLQIGRSHKVLVSYELLIEHLSAGSINRNWINDTILLSKKWKAWLPVGNYPPEKKKEVEWSEKRLFFLKMLVYKFGLLRALNVLLGFGYFRYFYLKGNVLFIKEAANSVVKKIGSKTKNAFSAHNAQ